MAFRAFGYHVAFAWLKGLAVPVTLLLGLAGAEAAAPPSQQALFDGYVASPAYRAILEKAYNAYEVAPLKAKCPTLKLVALDKPEMIEKPVFAVAGGTWQMTNGAWVARATLDACGSKVIRRAMVESAHNNTLRTRPLLPGEFGGAFKLEENARAVAAASMMSASGCTDYLSVVLLDITRETPVKPEGWIEDWTAQMCGKTVKGVVFYVADKSSGTGGFTVHTRDMKVVK